MSQRPWACQGAIVLVTVAIGLIISSIFGLIIFFIFYNTGEESGGNVEAGKHKGHGKSSSKKSKKLKSSKKGKSTKSKGIKSAKSAKSSK